MYLTFEPVRAYERRVDTFGSSGLAKRGRWTYQCEVTIPGTTRIPAMCRWWCWVPKG